MDPYRIRIIVSVAASAQQLAPVWCLLWRLTLTFGLVSCISYLDGVGGGCVEWGGRIRHIALLTADVDGVRVCEAVGGHFGDAVVRPRLRITCHHY